MPTLRTIHRALALFAAILCLAPTLAFAQSEAPDGSVTTSPDTQTEDSRIGVVAAGLCAMFGRAMQRTPGVPPLGLIVGAVATCSMAIIDAISDPDRGDDD